MGAPSPFAFGILLLIALHAGLRLALPWARGRRLTAGDRPPQIHIAGHQGRLGARVATIVTATLFALLAPTLAAPPDSGPPVLEVSPAEVQPGTAIHVSGQGFTAHRAGRLAFDGSTAGMPSYRPRGNGTFDVALVVPGTARTGSHTVTALAPAVIATTYLTVLGRTGATSTPIPTARVTASPTATPTSTPGATPKVTPPPTVQPSATPTPSPASGGPIHHVIVVWLENHEYTSVTSTSMPYLTSMAAKYGLATNYDAVSHPSLPNYLAFWSGSTQGVSDDGTYNFAARSLSTQFQAAGLSWRTAAQDYPTSAGCHTGSSYSGGVDGWGVAGTYARKHDPAMSFTAVGGANCADITPAAAMDSSANLVFVVPNLCNDAHDCSLATADTFLTAFVPSVLSQPTFADGSTLLVVTFDEGTSTTGGGGHVYTVLARAGMGHKVSSVAHNHYGLTRTIEDIFGLPCLANSCGAVPLSEFLP